MDESIFGVGGEVESININVLYNNMNAVSNIVSIDIVNFSIPEQPIEKLVCSVFCQHATRGRIFVLFKTA
jgi:hypothetical protein